MVSHTGAWWPYRGVRDSVHLCLPSSLLITRSHAGADAVLPNPKRVRHTRTNARRGGHHDPSFSSIRKMLSKSRPSMKHIHLTADTIDPPLLPSLSHHNHASSHTTFYPVPQDISCILQLCRIYPGCISASVVISFYFRTRVSLPITHPLNGTALKVLIERICPLTQLSVRVALLLTHAGELQL